MKKISLLLIASVLLFAGCELDRLPETTLTDAAFWKTENDLRGACNRLYEQLGGFWHDKRSDELVGTSADDTSSGSRSVPSTDDTNWRDVYRKIYVSNNILAKAVNTPIPEDAKNRWLAEARFFRAYNYFALAKRYGGVPMMLQPFDTTDDPEILKGRNTLEEVIAQCYEDLDFAIQWLPKHSAIAASSSDWGRASRSSALAMKARIGLYIGTLTKYHSLSGGDAKAHLKIALDACEAVMKEGHSLFPDFQKLFYFDGEGSGNKENIFVKVYGPNGAPTTTHGNSRQMENSVSVTRQMVDLFLYNDGLPRDKSVKKPVVEDSFDSALENRDPRLLMTVYKIGEEAYKGEYQPFSNQHGNGYSLKKGFMLDQWSTNSKEDVDKMIIRYAEVLVTYAEALYEYNGAITNSELDKTINLMRNRVGFDVKLTNEFVAANSLNMLEEIRRERTVEFIDENMRYDDIIRWKIAENVLPQYIVGAKFVDDETSKARKDLQARLTDANGMLNGVKVYDQEDVYVIELKESRRFDPKKDYLYPIPLNEISLTGNAIVQNPGWE
ncbi:RagB/SusD family nutrient uptake outer membrane protein [Bacteroides sp. 51]|uniref:RagB/SusD family nutrient uptake outer membrane protein n=1 Tax=Bacteroides sp. 51 TaxID=2302938 RepID=UPI0013CF7BB4|nr:RagB/SusD family nutrient uptake outer membrane protein [Bacteroides sp. 51]NDV80483.1 RagB/SusD family nutrient uptake outer membrane protein [Bacteroides sp. 51]